MTALFTIIGSRPLRDRPLQQHSVWMCEWAGRVYGIETSPVGYVSGSLSTDVLRMHYAISAIQRCFNSEELVELLQLDAIDIDAIFSDLDGARFQEMFVKVDGKRVRCTAIAYRGAEFASSADPLASPFTLVRTEGLPDPWPALTALT